ncbi:MAG: response regulator [Acidobacteriota bacterium]
MQTTPPAGNSRYASELDANRADGVEPRVVPAPTQVLVVDDEPLIAETIVQILNRSGFVAAAAYGGKEAIEAAQRMRPDLVLSDVLMPNVDGVEAAITIQTFLPATRIVLFSGQAATVEILARVRQRGYNFELLAKPLHPTELIRHLRQK